RGLGFWSDRYLADTHQGRDRLQGMALLNTELDLISPVLLSAGSTGSRTVWLDTSHPHVKAALIAGQKSGRRSGRLSRADGLYRATPCGCRSSRRKEAPG